MRKLTLRLDDLNVDSFDTATRRDGRGTVFGHTDRYTDCWGQCGVATRDGGICFASEGCTQDPLAGDCRSNFYNTRCAMTACDAYTCGETCPQGC